MNHTPQAPRPLALNNQRIRSPSPPPFYYGKAIPAQSLSLLRKTSQAVLAGGLIIFSGVVAARAQTTVYWDINTTTAGSGGATPTGNWSTSVANWNSASDGTGATANWNNTGANNAIFAAGTDATGTYTVTLATAISVGNITVDEGNVTLIHATNALTLAGSAGSTITTAAGTSLNISSVLAGSVALNKAGTGTLVLGGTTTNTHSGAININAGTLQIAKTTANTAIGDTAAVTVASGATLDVNGKTETIGSLAGFGAVTLGAGALTAGGDGSSTTWGGAISGGGSLTKEGAGTLTISGGSNTFTGGLNINGGTVKLATTLTSLANNALVTVATGGTLEIATTNPTNSLTNAIDVALNGGTYRMSGAGNTGAWVRNLSFTNGGAVTSGSEIGSFGGFNLIASGNITMTGPGNASFALKDGFALYNAATVWDIGSTGNLDVSTTVLEYGGSRTLTKNGTGTLTLSGTTANTYTGGTAVTDGTLSLNKTAGVNATGTGALVIGDATGSANSAVVTLQANNQIADTVAVTVNGADGQFNLNTHSETIGSLAGSGSVVLGTGGALTTGGSNADTTFTGTISGAGSVTKAGTGTFTLNGVNTFTGGLNINAGTLLLTGPANAANRLPNNATVTVATGGTLLTNVTNPTNTASNAINLTLNGGTYSQTGAANIGGWLNNVTLTAGSVMTTDGTVSNYAGANIFLNGTVTMTGSGTATINPLNGLGLASGNSVFDIGTGGNLSVATRMIDYNAGVATSNLVKNSGGTMTLSGTTANTYTGTTTVNDGTLSLNKTAGIDATGTGKLTIGDGTGAANSAIVTLQQNNQINDSSVVEMNTDGKLQLNGLTETIGSLAGSGNIALGTSGVLTAGRNNGSTTYSGVIADAGSFTKEGTGTTTFSGTTANTYSGTTTVNDGTLSLNKTAGQNATGTGALVIGDSTGSANTALVTLQAGNQINDTSAVTVNSDGQINVNGQTETVGSIAGSGSVVLGAGALTAGAANTTTDYSGVMSGTGSFTKSGSGTQTFSGASANTYTGTTTVNDGTLNLNKTAGVNAIASSLLTIGDGTGAASSAKVSLQASNQIANTTDVDLKTDGVLDVSTATETIDDLGGTGTLKISSGGTLTIDKIGGPIAAGEPGAAGFTGVLDVDGTLNVNGGLIKNSSSSVGTGTIKVTTGNTLEFQGTTTFNGTLELAANATLKLTDANLNAAALHVTGNSVIDFSGSSILTLGTLTIDAGVTLTINNWTKGMDALYVALWPGATYDQKNNGNTGPMNQIIFTGWTPSDSGWDSYNNEIYPQVPEPSTYGFLLLGVGVTLVASRRRRVAR